MTRTAAGTTPSTKSGSAGSDAAPRTDLTRTRGRATAPRRPRRGASGAGLAVAQLEARVLMTAGLADHGPMCPCCSPLADGLALGLQPISIVEEGLAQTGLIAGEILGATLATGGAPVTAASLTGIPILNSLLGAAQSLYLDFDGHFEASWGSYSNIATPAYDTDGNASSFSATETANMELIWRYVAEDFAPFNINVTTVEPPSFANGAALRVSIGGNGSWSGGTYGGIAYVNSFTNSIVNTVYVFPNNLGNGNPKYTADASSHESGHGFGLQHQSKYSGTTKVEEYSTGPGNGTAPLMGNSYGARRSLWWNGTTSSASTFQDDMAVIARSTNLFGYRPDDHGNTAASASTLVVDTASVRGSGIIHSASDVDVFSFTTDAGSISLTVSTPARVNNLAPTLELRDAGGSVVIASAGPSSTFSATVSASVAAGSYRVYVRTGGEYGNVGQYAVNGTIIPPTSVINTPTALAAAVISTSRVDLSWADNATNETGYRVERSTDGTNWSVLAGGVAANATSYSDTTAAAGTTYHYRVQAFNASASSDYSNSATATTSQDAPAAPAGLTATAASASRIDLRWNDVAGEASYRVERSTNGTTWAAVGTTGANATTYADTGLAANTTYIYRVIAVNSGGSSAPSNQASARTQAAPARPAAPTGLTATPGTLRVNLAWTDNATNEDGFRVERSTNNGKTWSTLATVGSNVTTHTDTGVNAKKTYVYRVVAFNAVGTSAYSNTASASPAANNSGGGGPRGGLAFFEGTDAPTTPLRLPAGASSSFGRDLDPGVTVPLVLPGAHGGTAAAEAFDAVLEHWSPLQRSSPFFARRGS